MNALDQLATGRENSPFEVDFEAHFQTLNSALKGARVLVVGGAGSIGSATVEKLTVFDLEVLHIVDQDENGLAECVRNLRSRQQPLKVPDLRTFPIDYGSEAARLLLRTYGPYSHVLNLAAIKHVRSEKDVVSLLQMFDTNIVKQARFAAWLTQEMPDANYFVVSTDKAANPVSFMGASKRAMEHVLFRDEVISRLEGGVRSARFANVAWSNGSLLQAFEKRMELHQPLAVPQNIKRYFVSANEAAIICILASCLMPANTITVPDLTPEKHLRDLTEIAMNYVRYRGYEPVTFTSETEAKSAIESFIASNQWPVLVTKPDTAGEKAYEEFVGDGETLSDCLASSLKTIDYTNAPASAKLEAVIARLTNIVTGFEDPKGLTSGDLKLLIGDLEPGFKAAHIASALSLDARM